MNKVKKILLLGCLCLAMSACVATVVGAAVDITLEVAKVPFKVVGAAADVVIPEADEDEED